MKYIIISLSVLLAASIAQATEDSALNIPTERPTANETSKQPLSKLLPSIKSLTELSREFDRERRLRRLGISHQDELQKYSVLVKKTLNKEVVLTEKDMASLNKHGAIVFEVTIWKKGNIKSVKLVKGNNDKTLIGKLKREISQVQLHPFPKHWLEPSIHSFLSFDAEKKK